MAFAGAAGAGDMEQLLDFSKEIDVGLLDRIINAVYRPTNPQSQQTANNVLMRFKEHPESWTRVDKMIETSPNTETKFFALSILEETIKLRWKMLPPDQREAIKGYIVTLVINNSTNPQVMAASRSYLHKIDMILVQILKQEWPQNWPTFIPDIVNASKTNETMCENNMVILKFMSEEVFDFSSGQMTHRKARYLKDTMCEQFGEIFQLCVFVVDNAETSGLIRATLETLLRFLTWIPLGFMFETSLIGTLVSKYLVATEYRNITLRCLNEIGSLKMETSNYDTQLVRLYTSVLAQMRLILPLSVDIADCYRRGSEVEQDFVQSFSLFLTGFLKEHAQLLEQPHLLQELQDGLQYLVLISDVDETEIFRITLEFWYALTEQLYQEAPFPASVGNSVRTPRRELYASVLTKVRRVLISHMPKPEEVLIVENENGEIVREFMPSHTDTINQYKTMRETLVYLTHLDMVDTRNIMTQLLFMQTDERYWGWKQLNTLCWAIGSISGAMTEEEEKGFLVTVIKNLLGLCELKRGKDNKAVVASNIMYIVGQYPRFLRAHWKFLKTVVYKLFEFMHETHEGVQDMACDTFIKIADKCRVFFVRLHPGEAVPFVDEILGTLRSVICDLSPQQVQTFYEALGYAVGAEGNDQRSQELIDHLMALPNQTWDQLVREYTSNSLAFVQDPEKVKLLMHFLKTNTSACTSIGHPFIVQLGRIYLDLLGFYKSLSQLITAEVALNGPEVVKTHKVRQIRGIKKETLRLFETWLSKSNDPTFVVTNFVPPLLECLLPDYAQSLPHAREAEVLGVMTALITKLEDKMGENVPAIMGSVFECTLEMINKDLSEFPDHRTNFFKMLEAIVCGPCFPALFVIPESMFRLVMEAQYWALKHTMRNVSDTGLTILMAMLRNMPSCPAAPAFYSSYFLTTIEHLLAVLSDSAYQSGFKEQAEILQHMIGTIETGVVSTPLWGTATVAPGMTNSQYVHQCLVSLLGQAFPNLQQSQAKNTVDRLFAQYADMNEFRTTLQDFLVNIKVYGEDEVYQEQERAQLETQKVMKQKQISAIPGMVNPYAVPDAMAD